MGKFVPERILFVCPTSSPIGGLQTWMDEIYCGLEEKGWEPIVALVHGPTTNDSAGYLAAHPRLSRTMIIDGSAKPMAARVRAVMEAIRSRAPEFYVPLTVIDAHDAVCALKLRNEFQGRYVLSLHGNLPQQIADSSLFHPFADLSVNPGALTCRLLEWAGMPGDRVAHVPNGTDLHELRSTDADPSVPLRLAYVGRLSQADKRVLDLVGLVSALEARGMAFELDIVGDGPCGDELRAALSGKQVRFHGFVDAETLARDLFPDWDVALLFSQSEAFGISLMEAMSHGVVPVSSRFVGHRSEGFLRQDETALLFDIGDMEACADAISRLSGDRVLLRRLARNGHSLAGEGFTWGRSVAGWDSALRAAREFPIRSVPADMPRRLEEGTGLASRFPRLPRNLIDAAYRYKHRLLGIPPTMRFGEEWPLNTRCFEQDALRRIEAKTIELDDMGVAELSSRIRA